MQMMKHKDSRIKTINEILQGMKIIKLYGWEPSFQDQVADIRHRELDQMEPKLKSATIQWWQFFEKFTTTLVTQPMMQRRPNCTELRSMDSYIQIVCRFQKSKQKVPPPSLPCTKKSPFTPQRMRKKNHPLGGKGCFLIQGSDDGGTFRLLFWNLHKIWI